LKTRNFDEIIWRNKAFVNMDEVDRPLLGIWVGSYVPLQLYKSVADLEGRLVVPEMINPRNFLDDYDRIFLEHEQVGDDICWTAMPFFGIPWMEAIIGCPIYLSSKSFWPAPCLDNWKNLDEIKLVNNKWFLKLLEFEEMLIRHAKGKYPVATSTLMRGPGDMMGAALGQERLILELYNNRENVKKLCSIYTIYG